MVKRKRRIGKKAPTKIYLDAAKNLAPFVPKLRKFKRRKTLKPSEKSQIARYQKRIGSMVPTLYPLTKKEAKKLGKKYMVSPSIQAIRVSQLDKARTKIKIKPKGFELQEKTLGGARQWIFWEITKPIYENGTLIPYIKSNPWDKIEALVREAFRTYDIKQMHVWNTQGIAGFGYANPSQFLKHYYGIQYDTETSLWLRGIAFIGIPKKKGKRK